MVADLKHFDGSLRPHRPRARGCEALYATAFEIETGSGWSKGGAPAEVDRPGAVAQHLHGRRLGQKLDDETYKLAWLRGLKTT